MLQAIVNGDYVKSSFENGNLNDCLNELLLLNDVTIKQLTKRHRLVDKKLPDWFYYKIVATGLLFYAKREGYESNFDEKDFLNMGGSIYD